MDLGIKNRLALVTGSSRGIGRAIAKGLAAEGARVILVARTAAALETVRQELAEPARHHVVAVDLLADGGVAELVGKIAALGPLEILVHNLGGSANVQQVLAPTADWQRVWQFNVGIGHELNRALLPAMIERRWGRIVHLSTLSTTTHQGHAAYVSAKCALDGYVKAVGREVSKHNVILSAVAPGAILLEGRYFAKAAKENPAVLEEYYKAHLPIHRLGTGEDVAAAVAFLCSEQASYLAGARIAVDGGWM